MMNLEYGVTIINVEQLLHEAVEAFNNNETIDGTTMDHDQSTKLDHDDLPISRGNSLMDPKGISRNFIQKRRFHRYFTEIIFSMMMIEIFFISSREILNVEKCFR